MSEHSTGKRTHRRDRVARRFLYFIGLLFVLVLSAPTIIAALPARNTLLAQALPPEAGVLTARGASLGWFSPVSLSGVQLTDTEGHVIFRAEEVKLNRTLLALASNRSDLGTLQITRPALLVSVRPDGSSLEDLLTKLNAAETTDNNPNDQATASATQLTVVVTGASVAVTDAVTGRTLVHDPINLTATIDGGLTSLDAAGFAHAAMMEAGEQLPPLPLQTDGNPRGGQFSVQFAPATTGANEASFRLASFRLAALEPWLRRVDASMQLDGVADGQGGLTWWPTGPQGATLDQPITTGGKVRIGGFRFASELTAGDSLQTASVELPWQITSPAGGRLLIEQLGVHCDLANANLAGDFSAAELKALASGDWSAPRSVRIHGDVDLARLAQFAPNALHLNSGVAIKAGNVQLDASATPNASGGRTIAATLKTADLVGIRHGRTIRWAKPLSLELAANEAGGQMQISRLSCESSFLTGSASGNLNNLRGKAEIDLSRLVSDTNQLFDYGRWQLSGKASAEGELQRTNDRRFRASGSANIDGCVIAYDGRPLVMERKLTLTANANGQSSLTDNAPAQLASADLNILSGGDRLDARLTTPTTMTSGQWPLDLRLAGDIAAWMRRLKSIAPDNTNLTALQVSGTVDARAVGQFGAERVQVDQAKVLATDLKLATESLTIDEPRAEFSGDIVWEATTGNAASRSGQLVTSTVALQARQLLVQSSGASGELAVRADLDRLSNWLRPTLGARKLSGNVTGGVRLGSNPAIGQHLTANVNLAAQKFAITERTASGQTQVLWQEPTLRVQGTVGHQSTADSLTLQAVSIASQNLSGVVNGQISQLSTSPTPAINGTFDYDLARLTPVLASWTGPGVALVGRHQARFELAAAETTNPGAHWSQRWRGSVQAPWTSASVYGLPVGQGQLVASLDAGMLRTEPIQFAVGGGTANLQPVAQLDPPPAMWGVPAGQLVSDVVITQEISERMLKYIAPVLADATRSEGTFSLRTEGMRTPLASAQGGLSAMQTSGQLTIRNLRVTPGPSTANWVSIARTVEALAKDRDPTALASRPTPTLLSISERTVNFQVANGRVHHQGLQFMVDGVPVSSSGSVGFDETLQLVLSIPIQDRWIENERRLVGLKGQVIALPIGGSLSNPKVDQRQLQALSQQLLQSGLRGVVEEELGGLLEKLFD